ncbi:MAG: TPM domain-containing protein [Syntrophorhabdaceae bacterium]|nr:TPM domain-containing protein [Syntrophorhabdaceae bacterium]
MRHKKAERFFTKDEKERIKGAITASESKTSGEIATMIVDSSCDYRDADVMGGVLLAGFISLMITIFFFHSSLWLYIPTTFILFFPCRVLFKRFPEMKIAFVSRKRMEKEVINRAIRGFYEKGLYRTKDNTGVLFFISLLERKVWVIADKGIHRKMEQYTLNRFANMVSKGIKEGRACDALCEAIKEAGEALARHYPVQKDDINELTDDMITE